MGRDPGEIYRDLTREFGEPVYDRVEAPATPAQKQLLAQLSPEQVTSAELAGEKIQSILTQAPGNDAPIGGLKVVAENGWFAARPSGTEDIYKIYAESFRGADHLRRILAEAQAIVGAALRREGGARMSEHGAGCAVNPSLRQPLACGRRGIRFPGRAGAGYALVLEPRHRPGVAAARSRAVGAHA